VSSTKFYLLSIFFLCVFNGTYHLESDEQRGLLEELGREAGQKHKHG
jgi:hypothetical protein